MQKNNNSRLGWILVGIILGLHILFLLGLTTTPHWYAIPLAEGGVFNIGMLIGTLLLILPPALMLYYFQQQEGVNRDE